MAAAFRAIQDGKPAEAATLAAPFGYSVVDYTDVVTNRRLSLLAERQNPDGSWPHAWGLYIHSVASSSDMTVEVAHPHADVDTELVGVDIFRASDSANLFVSGADRDARADGSADVAHSAHSIFEAIHEEVLGSSSVIVQPHGFRESGSHRTYGDVVVSSGTGQPPEQLQQLARSLRSAGLRVCLYDGVQCRGLGGTTNVQGRTTRLSGGQFVHVEMAPQIRASRARSALVARIIAAALA